MELMKLTLDQYLDNAQTKEPNPGGGSVAAYVGGLGAALSNMVLNLSYGKEEYESLDQAIKDEMEDLKVEFDKTIQELKVFVDEDSESFNSVLDAFKMPKDTEEEKEKRSKAIQEGYVYALNVPLETARLCHKTLGKLDLFVDYGTITAITDVGCSVLFLASAIEAALFNVTINLQAIKDEDFVKETENEVENLISDAHKYRDGYLERIYDRLNKGE